MSFDHVHVLCVVFSALGICGVHFAHDANLRQTVYGGMRRINWRGQQVFHRIRGWATCESFVCSKGYDSRNHTILCHGIQCSNEECCEQVVSCVVHLCPAGYMQKDLALRCQGTSCTDAECCELVRSGENLVVALSSSAGRTLGWVTGVIKSGNPEQLFAELDWKLHMILSLFVFFGIPVVLLHPAAVLFDAHSVEIVVALTCFMLSFGSYGFAVAAGIIAGLAKDSPIGSLFLSSFPGEAAAGATSSDDDIATLLASGASWFRGGKLLPGKAPRGYRFRALFDDTSAAQSRLGGS